MFNADQMNQVVSAAVVAALETQAQPILGEIVKSIIERKVNRNGGDPGYNDRDTTSFLHYLVSRQIEQMVGEAVREWAVTRKDEVAAAIKVAINADSLASALTGKVMERVESGYISVDLGFRE